MKDPVKRLFYTIIITIAFLVFYALIMFLIDRRNYEELIVMHNQSQTESMRGILDQYEKTEKEIREVYTEDLNSMIRMKVLTLTSYIADGQYEGPRMWNNGMVVRVINDSLDIPSEAAGMFPDLTADIVRNEYSMLRTTKAKGEAEPAELFLTSGRIAGEWYYVGWRRTEEYDAFVRSYVDRQEQMTKLSDYFDGEMILVSADESGVDGEKGTVLYGSEGVEGFGTISELGISEEELQNGHFSLNTNDGNEYICTSVVLESGEILICCASVKKEKMTFLGDVVTQILFASAMFAALLVWCYSVMAYVVETELKGEQIYKYSPGAVKRKTMKLLRVSVILVFVVAFLTVLMQHMYQEDKAGNVALNILENQIEEETVTASNLEKINGRRYIAFGEEISEILQEDSGLIEKDRLAELAALISADYLIVFDENGNEIGCSEDYTGFSLGTDAQDPSADYRKLLKGISSVVHEPEQDFITGEVRQIIGVRYDIPDRQGQYGAILIALPPELEKEHWIHSTGKQWIYNALSSNDVMILEIDPNTQMIESESWGDFAGHPASSIGISKESLLDQHMDFFRVDKKWYFGISRLINGKIYYYMINDTAFLLLSVMFAVLTAVIFMIGYWLTAKFALHDYTKTNYAAYAPKILEARQKNREKLDENSPFMSEYVEKWDYMMPEQRTRWVLQIELGLFMATLLAIAVSNTPMAEHSALNFIIEGNWTKGINLFGIVAVTMVFSIEYLVYLIVKVVFLLFYGVLDAKGETVGRLLRSLINYVLIASAICLSLSFLGVDTTTILTSLGLLSLAISLGAKDLVADVLSGITIVFDGIYGVGDFVEIGDYKGRVMEIGIRCTRLLGVANDVKTISNSSISNVRNLSRRPSFCVVTFTVKASESLDEIEKMLAQELPTYKDKIPGIISGPTFTGVSSLQDGKMTLQIIAEARQEDLLSVNQGMNRMLQSLYERKLIKSVKTDNNIVMKFASDESGVLRMRNQSDAE